MVLEPKNAVKGVVVSYRQGEPHGEIMLVTDDGKSQVLSLSIPLLSKLLEQSAMALARAATQLPIPPAAIRSEHDVMRDVCKILKDDNNGDPTRENTTFQNQEYSDVAYRTEAALDTPHWVRRNAPHIKTS